MDGELVHDLRIPLQLISGCAQLLEQELGQNARARGYVETLLGSVGQMQRMLSGPRRARCAGRAATSSAGRGRSFPAAGSTLIARACA